MIIPPTWSLPSAIRARLGQNTYGRQRAILEEGHLLLVLHQPPGADDSRREGVLFWRTPDGEWQHSRGGPGITGLRRHVQSYDELEDKLTAAYESAATTSELFELLESLTPLARSARNMHQALQAAREAIKADSQLIEMRDLAYEIERNLDLLLEDVRHAIQYRIARESEAQAQSGREAVRASHRLNILAALFFPLIAIASLFGMNLAHGLNDQHPPVFWFVFAVGAGLGFVMKGWVVGWGRGTADPGK
jgi:hypothetical protein